MIATGGKNGKSRVRKIAKKNNKRSISNRSRKAGVSKRAAAHRCGRGGGVPKKIGGKMR